MLVQYYCDSVTLAQYVRVCYAMHVFSKCELKRLSNLVELMVGKHTYALSAAECH